MTSKRIFPLFTALLTVVSLQAIPQLSAAHDGMMGRGGYGPGMMGGGYGPGMMGGGYGMGMMGGGYSMGMMGGGYGMGMMGGYGRGMMGGYGMGPMHGLELSKQQRDKINAIHDDLRKQNWQRMGKMMDAMSRMRALYQSDTPDPKAIGKAFAEISDIKRQMLEARVAAHNKLNQVFTAEQRKELRERWRGRYGRMGPQGGPMMHR
jgi:Spy/CpxP family protein refolding chaperone